MSASESHLPSSGPLTPTEYAVDMTAAATIVELKLLDNYWTAQALRPAAERSDLTPVVDRMTELLRTLATLAPSVAETSRRHGPELQARFDARIDSRPRVRELANQNAGEDFAAFSARVADEIVRRTDDEIEHLRSENERIRAELPSAGDMTVEFDLHVEAFGYTLDVHVEGDKSVIGGLLGLLFG